MGPTWSQRNPKSFGEVWAMGVEMRPFPTRLIRLNATLRPAGTAKWRRWIPRLRGGGRRAFWKV